MMIVFVNSIHQVFIDLPTFLLYNRIDFQRRFKNADFNQRTIRASGYD